MKKKIVSLNSSSTSQELITSVESNSVFSKPFSNYTHSYNSNISVNQDYSSSNLPKKKKLVSIDSSQKESFNFTADETIVSDSSHVNSKSQVENGLHCCLKEQQQPVSLIPSCISQELITSIINNSDISNKSFTNYVHSPNIISVTLDHSASNIHKKQMHRQSFKGTTRTFIEVVSDIMSNYVEELSTSFKFFSHSLYLQPAGLDKMCTSSIVELSSYKTAGGSLTDDVSSFVDNHLKIEDGERVDFEFNIDLLGDIRHNILPNSSSMGLLIKRMILHVSIALVFFILTPINL